MKQKDIGPKQKEGVSTDIKKVIKLSSVQEAKNHFEIVKQRLLNVSGWHKLSKISPAAFQLTTSAGKEIWRNAREGDLFKITLPAPGPNAGGGFDWVKIYSVKNEKDESTDSEFLAITVKPAKDPRTDKTAAAHFFSSSASSTFIVNRIGNTISAEVHGRNETPNVKNTGIADTLRNTFVALGAMLGLADIQWKTLVKGLVSRDS